MKYLGEETKVAVVSKSVRKVEYIRCDNCEKKILPHNYRDEKNSYIHVHTWHNDWGNDSIDSHERHDYCKECASKVVSEYILSARGTEELELENKHLYENITHDVYYLDEYGYSLSADDNTDARKENTNG